MVDYILARSFIYTRAHREREREKERESNYVYLPGSFTVIFYSKLLSASACMPYFCLPAFVFVVRTIEIFLKPYSWFIHLRWFKQHFIQDKIKVQRIVMCSSTSCSL